MGDDRHTTFGLLGASKLDVNYSLGAGGPEASPILTGSHSLHPVRTRGKPQPELISGVPIPEEEHNDWGDLTRETHRGKSSSFPPWNYLFDIFMTPKLLCVAAQTNHSSPRFVLIQRLSGPAKFETQTQTIARIKHKNFAEEVATFVVGKSHFVAWSYMPFSLLHLVSRRRDLDDLMTAPILRQVSGMSTS